MQLTTIFTLILVLIPAQGADQSSQPADPFAALHRSIDQRFSAILQDEEVTRPSPADAEPTPTPPAPPSAGADQTDVFAKRFWSGRRSDLASALSRLEAIRPALEQILESEGIPKELIAVVLVESAARPYALSPRQARGLWQLIPETARQYGLQVSPDRDDRVQMERATRAAARYLRDLHRAFENWPLALAAYNAGQDAVQKAMQRSGGTSFWELSAGRRLPEETRNYVPAVLAAMKLLGADAPSHFTQPQRSTAPWIYASIGTTN
jgi:membrane-bound lytic murein transglycosylase D